MSRHSCFVLCALFCVAFCVAAALPVLATPAPPASAYVQAGLIAQWDGIENAGVGQHDASATTWKDLKGSADVTLGDGDLICEGAGVIVTDKRAFAGVPSANASSPKTLEIAAVETVDIGVNQAARIFFLERRLGMSFDHRYAGGTFNVATSRDSAPGVCYFQNVKNDSTPAEAGKFHTYSAILGMSKAMTPYYDGATTTMGSNLNWADNISGAADGSGYIGASVFKPRIYSIRLYDHALTSGEIAVNANIDKIRFEDADPGALVWPDGCQWNAEKGAVEISVLATAGEHGLVKSETDVEWSSSTSLFAPLNAKLRLFAKPDEGYQLDCWLLDGGVVGTSSTLELDPARVKVGANELTARFRAIDRSTVFDELLVRDGLVFRCDASVDGTVETNGQGRVLKWSAVETGPSYGGFAFTNYNAEVSPSYAPNMFANGLPGVYLDAQINDNGDGTLSTNTAIRTRFFGNYTTSIKTFFIVERYMAPYTYAKLWTPFTTDTADGFHQWSNKSGNGYLYINGVCVSSPVSAKSNGISSYNGISIRSASTFLTAAAVLAYHEDVFKEQVDKLGASGDNTTVNRGSFIGGVGEVLAYDRVLTPAEVRAVNSYLSCKWRNEQILTSGNAVWTPFWQNVVWTGGGDGKSWGDPENWSTGEVPNRQSSVRIVGATVKVDGLVFVDNLRLDNASVAVQAGGRLDVDNLFYARDAATVTVGAGGDFRFCDAVIPSGAALTVDLDGGTATWQPRNPIEFNANAYTRARPEDIPALALPCAVTGAGTLVVAGAGRVKLDADLPSSVALKANGGQLDLCGRDITLVSLGGIGQLTNSAARIPTVTLTGDADAELGGWATARINVVKRGAGTATVHGGYGQGGSLAVEAGAAKTDAYVAPTSLPGLMAHLDASRPDTLVTNAEGRVIEWLTSGGLLDRFREDPEKSFWLNGSNPKYPCTSQGPKYSPTAFDGKPGLLFSIASETATSASSAETNALVATTAVTNRSVVMVVKPMVKVLSWADAYFGAHRQSGAWLVQLQHESGRQYWEPASGSGSRFYINGAKVFDYDAGITDTTIRPWTLKKGQVIVCTKSNANTSSNVFRPSVGSGQQQYIVRRAGAVISEVLVYENELSEADVRRLTASLMKKWDITYDNVTITGETCRVDGRLPEGPVSLGDGTTLDLGGTTNEIANLTVSGTVAVTNGALKVDALNVLLGDDGAYGAVRGDADWDVDGMALAFVGDARPAYGNIVRTSGTIFGTLGPITPSAVAPRVKTSVSRIWIPGGLLLFER